MPRTNFYTAPTPGREPRTRWARQMDAWMRVNGLSKSGAYKKLGHLWDLGSESRTAWLPYLIDKPVPEAIEPHLAAIVGWPPEEEAEPEPETTKEPQQADLPGLVSALTAALLAQAQALTDIRLELAQAARDAAEEREATGDVLARLEAQLEQLQASVDSGAGTADPRSGRRN